MRNLLKRIPWAWKHILSGIKWIWTRVKRIRPQIKRILQIVKYHISWASVNFGIGLLPVYFTLAIDYDASTNNFVYKDTVLLSAISFSFAFLIASHYSRVIWGTYTIPIEIIIFLYLFILLGVYIYYYTMIPYSAEKNFFEILTSNGFYIAGACVSVTWALGTFLYWRPALERYKITEEGGKMEDIEMESEEERGQLEADLDSEATS